VSAGRSGAAPDQPGGAESRAVAPGLVLDGRYRLELLRSERAAGDARIQLWRAVDEPLERHVAVLVVSGLRATARAELLKTATRISRFVDGRCVRILDVGALGARSGAAWVASEWVDGPSLAALLRNGPLPGPVAAEIVWQCADVLALAADHGLEHGWLQPDHVLLPAGGVPRITGLGLTAALHPDVEPVRDGRSLGALLFAALTGRWPLPNWTGLPPVDERTARAARPRLVRGGVDPALDQIAYAALTGSLADPAAVASALAKVPRRSIDAPEPAPPARRSLAWQRWAWRIVPPVAVVALAAAAWGVGRDLGRLPNEARQPRAALPPAHANASGATATLVWHRPPLVSSFDPEGDGQENDDQAELAVDRDPTTAWTTARYRGDPHFGGLKSGVGLLIDLRTPASVRLAELALTTAGADVEIRAGDTRPQQAADLPLVATTQAAPVRTRFTFARPVRARYWLIWFTSLPKQGDAYQVGVAEVALLG
jgi:putative peptidoglycan lipid II flippase